MQFIPGYLQSMQHGAGRNEGVKLAVAALTTTFAVRMQTTPQEKGLCAARGCWFARAREQSPSPT